MMKNKFWKYPAAMVLIAFTTFASLPAQAVFLDITFNESDFGFPGTFPTLNNGATWTGAIESTAYTNAAATDFAIDSFSINIDDRNGISTLFSETTTTTSGNPLIRNDGAGDPDHLTSSTGNIGGLAESFSWDIPVILNGTPSIGFILSLNNISIPGGNIGTWSLADFQSDGFGIVSGSLEQFRFGTYEISVSAVPVPAAAWLFGSGLVGLAGIARRNNTL